MTSPNGEDLEIQLANSRRRKRQSEEVSFQMTIKTSGGTLSINMLHIISFPYYRHLLLYSFKIKTILRQREMKRISKLRVERPGIVINFKVLSIRIVDVKNCQVESYQM